MLKKIFLIIFLIINFSIEASELDEKIDTIVIKHGLQKLEKVKDIPKDKILLGARLFSDRNLSGNKNISCMDCHHPMLGTGDTLSLSLGEGSEGHGLNKSQKSATILLRNSPPLFNLGYRNFLDMFYDGRVSFDPTLQIFNTPEVGLNGENPAYKNIVKNLDSALAAQALFPLVNIEEMKGRGPNSVSQASSNLDTWNVILNERILPFERYESLFKRVYPGELINIGHVADSIAAFISVNFNLVDTPYDRYLGGEKNALTSSEKRGLLVFAERGKCIQCHNGQHLTNFEYRSVGVPQIGTHNNLNDLGRYNVTFKKSDSYKFKTPPLRNIALSWPYFHNGAITNLKDLIEHYNDIEQSLFQYETTKINLTPYMNKIEVDRDLTRNKLRFNLISIGEVRRGLKLTDEEKEDLFNFLNTGILDYKFQPKRL